jgi:hypothetical protein
MAQVALLTSVPAQMIQVTNYRVTTGVTYGVSAWETGNCDSGGGSPSAA